MILVIHMSKAVTKGELLSLISQGLTEVETSISHHLPETVSLYQNANRAFLEGQSKSEETEWSRGVGMSLDELAIVHQYLFATAFMSAWYHVHGDRSRRDQATSPACVLVSGLGFTPEDVLHRYMKYEHAWRASMRAVGMGRGKRMTLLILLFLAVAAIIWVILH